MGKNIPGYQKTKIIGEAIKAKDGN